MKKQKLSKAEKMMVKALIELNKEKGIKSEAHYIEIDMMHITDNTNMEHRLMVEDYAQEIINKGYEW